MTGLVQVYYDSEVHEFECFFSCEAQGLESSESASCAALLHSVLSSAAGQRRQVLAWAHVMSLFPPAS